jgi:N-acetylmuramoyl-L-alanine amidase
MADCLALIGIFLAAFLLAGCASVGRVELDSANQNSRVRMVVIHHTTSDFQRALDALTLPSDRPVSAHYLLPEPGDSTYGEQGLKVHALWPEEKRAWHAGVSHWAGRSELNDISIGIELVNQTYCHEEETDSAAENGADPASICFYPDFAVEQMDMLLDLLRDISERHPGIKPVNIVGHADIAPQRRIDPGPRFPWQRLFREGFGAWYDDETVVRYWEHFRTDMPSMLQLQDALQTYGYPIVLSGSYDTQSRKVIRAFQMHFTPSQVTQEFGPRTAAVLFALIEKYHPGQLSRLLRSPESTSSTP